MLKAAPLCLTQLSAAATLAEPLICSVRSSSSTKSKSVAVSSHFVLGFFPASTALACVVSVHRANKQSTEAAPSSLGPRVCLCLGLRAEDSKA